MGFCNIGPKPTKISVEGLSLQLLHESQCSVCPLHHQTELKTPGMEPSGVEHPIVYMLGEAPGAEEDLKGEPFVGKAGRTLRQQIPREWLPHVRFNNVVRTRPPGNRTPTLVEMECCRPSIVADIERSKPKAIFGFGGVPLRWAMDATKIGNWMGRHIPIKVGTHSCWFFPMYHPSYINRTEGDRNGREIRFAWELHLKNAFELVETLPAPVVHDANIAMQNIAYVKGDGPEDVDTVLEQLHLFAQEDVVGLDYETNHLRPYSEGAKILSVALAGKDRTFAFPLFHSMAGWTKQGRREVDDAFCKFLYKTKVRKVAHHLPFEMEWSGYFYGKDCLRDGLWGCSESQAYVLDSRRGTLSLNFLGMQHFGLYVKDLSNVNVKQLDAVPLDMMLPYNALDAKYCRLLFLAQRKHLHERKQNEVYQYQLQRIPTVVLTQMKGVPVHQETVNKMHDLYSKHLNKVETEIDESAAGQSFYTSVGHHFRPSAQHDVGAMLQKVLKLQVDGTDETALQTVKHPIAKLTLRWRKANKLLSTYVKPVMEGSPHLYPDGMLHPIINLCSTTTWRTSGEDPNLQNWPKRQTKEVRAQIRPGPGYCIVSFDYGQIQARNVAMESKDKTLIKAFWDHYDIHADWMQRIQKIYPRWINGSSLSDKDTAKKYRNIAKNGLVFPLFFGAHAKKISDVLKVPVEYCTRLREHFLGMFPNVEQWHNGLDDFYYKNGYVTGLSGFRRYAPCIQNERINSPIQGDESLIVCDAWARLSRRDHDHLQAIMEIHDDLTFVMRKEDVDELSEVIITEMLQVPFEWARVVPISVEMSVGPDWLNMEEVGVFESLPNGGYKEFK